MKKITILDYGLGNIRSLKNSLKLITNNVSYYSEDKNENFDILFIPGVGSFSKASEILFKNKYNDLIFQTNKREILIIGICLGMHLLLSKGYEDGESLGLDFINGYVDKIPVKNKKLPNIGWRKVEFSDNKNFSFLKNLITQNFILFIRI